MNHALRRAVMRRDGMGEIERIAREAGMRTALLDRREDYPDPRYGDAAHGHARVEGFDGIDPDA